MSIFGQVWLWSVAAFLIGVLLTWLVLVRPVQSKNRQLERKLQVARKAPAPERKPAPPTKAFVPESEPVARREPEPESFLASLNPAPAPVEHHSEPNWLERDSFGESPNRHERREDAEPELFEPSSVTEFVGRSAVLEPESEPESFPPPDFRGRSVLEPEPGPFPSGVTAFVGRSAALEPEAETESTSIFRPVDDEPVADKGSERGSLFDPGSRPKPDFSGFGEPEPDPRPPAYAFGDGEAPDAPSELASETTQVLPRRQPRQRQSPPGGFEPPQPIQPSMRAIERREPSRPDEGGHSGSLFEPAVQPGGAHAISPDSAPPPPPARKPMLDSSVPPGPFGPGSAMPRPGGGSPSGEFAVKASVTALRYCTEDSPQYSRMVAEVWFRSAADAERVGFRPLT
ncbi:MAG TPA: hypothetical protein VJT49_31650 [Amycolatopsis sp.]|uniref:sunset domain-containing protein n=1 Tax=Amycolatopsis sp. TaxID=37632 RepID=UPI002B468AE8|nr:hypothetical protein [Amycolatopsis sp.]HKS49587.1 hypothetical protein [Amycolatopsis sp.]